MLKITVNGEPKTIASPQTLDRALTDWGYRGPTFAVAVSGKFVPRGRYRDFRLEGGESIEVLSPMQGG